MRVCFFLFVISVPFSYCLLSSWSSSQSNLVDVQVIKNKMSETLDIKVISKPTSVENERLLTEVSQKLK